MWLDRHVRIDPVPSHLVGSIDTAAATTTIAVDGLSAWKFTRIVLSTTQYDAERINHTSTPSSEKDLQ
jgi:hypothetical protein